MIIADGRTGFYQWDRGQRLRIDSFTAGTEIHFSLKPDHIFAAIGNDNLIAKIAIAYEENDTVYVDIPNLLLQISGTLQVYIYHRSANEGHTIEKTEFSVLPRPRPDDYIYTEAEQKYWEALEAQLLHPICAEGMGMTQPVGADSEGKLWTYPSDPTPIQVDTELSITSTNPIANCTVAGIAEMADAAFSEIGEMMNAYGEAINSLGEELTSKADAPLPGDVNGDGVVDAADAELLRHYLTGEKVSIVDANADVNGDGELNLLDVERIEQYLSGMEVTLLPSPMATKAFVKKSIDERMGTASAGTPPVFDLAEMGLSTVAANGGLIFLETDATEICTALENGASTFVIPFSMGDEVLSLRVTMNGIGISGAYMGVAHLYTSEPLVIILGANANMIMVSSVSMQTVLGIPTVTGEDNGKLIQVVGGEMQAVSVADSAIATFVGECIPTVTAEDNGKLMQVVDGEMQAVSVADSPIAAYIDDYIATALGGDY